MLQLKDVRLQHLWGEKYAAETRLDSSLEGTEHISVRRRQMPTVVRQESHDQQVFKTPKFVSCI